MEYRQALKLACFYAVKMRRDYAVLRSNGECWVEPAGRNLVKGDVVYIAEPSYDSAIISGIVEAQS